MFENLPKNVRRSLLAGLMLCVALSSGVELIAADKKPAGENKVKVNYVEHVLPILRQKCFSCHSTNKKEADLDLSSYASLMQGGGSGVVVESGNPEESYLYQLITHESEPSMPPNSDKLPDEMLAVFKSWIEGGLLENAGSKAVMAKKPKFDFALKGAPTGKPEGPPPMPGRLSLETQVRTNRSTAVSALATSPWAPLVAVSGQKQVLLYHTGTAELLGVLPFPEGDVNVLKFSRSGDLLLAGGGRGGASGLVVVWNIKTGERVMQVGDELDAVLAADISADQTMIALGGPARVVRIYSTVDGQLLHELKKHTDWIYSVAFSPDSVLLATGDRNGGTLVWEAYTAREYATLTGHSGAITGFSWRSDSNILASCSEDSTIKLWEMENGGNVKSWGAHGGGTAWVEFTRDGRLVSCGRDRTPKLWDQAGKQLLAFPAFSDLALRITHCDETNHVIAGDWTGAIRVWNAADGKPFSELSMNPPTLAERLAAVQQTLPPQEAELIKQTEANNAAQAAADKAQADLAAANKAVTETQNQQKQAVEAAQAAKVVAEKLTGEHQAVAKTVETLTSLVPLLSESAAKAKQAAEKNPGDKELATAVTQLLAQSEKNAAALDAAKKALPEKATALEKGKQVQVAAEKQVVDITAALEAAQKRQAEVQSIVNPTMENAAKAKQALDAIGQKVAATKAAIARWQSEIAFTEKLSVLSDQTSELDQLTAIADGAAAEFKVAQEQLEQANQASATAQQQVQAATEAVKKSQATVAAATEAEAAAGKTVATLEALIPPLKETLDKSGQAVEKAGGDKDVIAVAAQLKAVFEKKTSELAASKQAFEDAKAVTAKAKTDLQAAEKKAVEATTALEAAKKQVVEKTAIVTAAQAKLDAAKQAVDKATKQIEQTKSELANIPSTRAET